MPTTINDELLRIEGAKSDIATAIANKGVTVPPNAKIDDMADLIDAIQAGGGSPNLQSKSVSITSNGTTNVVADSGYDGLSSVEIGVNVESYYNWIKGFLEDTLTDVVIPDGVTIIRDHGARSLYSAVTITIPDSLTEIKSYGFYQTTNMTTFNGGSGLQEIRTYCFYGCTKLANVNLPSIVNLRGYCFDSCSQLTSLVLPDNIDRIEGYAFRNTGLTTLVIKATAPPTLTGTSWLQNTPISSNNGYIYVPNSVVNDYKNANNWTNIASQIKGYDVDAQGRIVDHDDNTHIIVNADGTIYVAP